jgi:triacylglycerol lipase
MSVRRGIVAGEFKDADEEFQPGGNFGFWIADFGLETAETWRACDSSTHLSRFWSVHSPVVLQHGLFGFSDMKLGKLRLSYFNGIDCAIAERGHPLIVCRVHPTSSIELRARQLRAQILSQLRTMKRPKERVIIIAHSMGGLDARYMISKLEMADRVAALVTISTPHRGSPYADWVLKNLGKRMGGLKLVKLLHLDLQAIRDLTTEACKEFNEEIEDSPDVR